MSLNPIFLNVGFLLLQYKGGDRWRQLTSLWEGWSTNTTSIWILENCHAWLESQQITRRNSIQMNHARELFSHCKLGPIDVWGKYWWQLSWPSETLSKRVVSLVLVTSSDLGVTLVGVACHWVDITMEGGRIGWHSKIIVNLVSYWFKYRVRMRVAVKYILTHIVTKAGLACPLSNPCMPHQLPGGYKGCHSLPMGGWHCGWVVLSWGGVFSIEMLALGGWFWVMGCHWVGLFGWHSLHVGLHNDWINDKGLYEWFSNRTRNGQ